MKLDAAFDLALRYWAGLRVPHQHVAASLRTTVEAVDAGYRRLAADPDAGCADGLTDLAGYPSREEWPARTAVTLIRKGLARPTDAQLVIVAGEGVLGTGEVRASVARIAAGLAAAGVVKGDRVAVDATQRIESWLVAVATLLLGGVVVRLSLPAGPAALHGMIAEAPAKLTFSKVASALDGLGAAGTLVDLDDPDGFAAWLDACPDEAALPEVAVSPADPALTGFTSGSTGRPKCVLVSHEAVFRSTEGQQALFAFGPDDIFCTSTDFSALSAFRAMLASPFLCGGRVVLPSPAALESPLALAADCAEHGVTRLTAVPNVLRGMALACDRIGPLPRLRMVFSGSGVLDQSTRDRFHAAFPVPVIDYYGGREFTTPVYTRPADTGTVSSRGGLVTNCLLRIVDDAGTMLPDGEIGVIMVHSDCMASGDLAGTLPAWRGWHDSGDLGRMTEDGLLQIVGRRRDVIKAADGSLVFPFEIETLLNALTPVRESCVFGMSGSGGAEHVVAAVILAAPADDIESLARRHVLAAAGRFRVPTRVIALDDFPRVAAQKVDKAALRSLLAPQLRDF